MAKVASKKQMYTVDLQLVGSAVHGKGATLLDAVRAMEKPLKITTKGVITIKHGKKKFSRPLTVREIKRFFYPVTQPITSRIFGEQLR